MSDYTNDQEKAAISRLVLTKGTTRVYELDDGSFQERDGGSASWRHNNPGNLKFEYSHSDDPTVHNPRSKETALSRAQSNYHGVVDLDQRGNAIFDTYEHGRAAQEQYVTSETNRGRTVAEMLGNYSKPDYSGPTHYGAQEAMIYATGDEKGVDLRTKKIRDMSPQEVNALADGISKFEGWNEGKTATLTTQQVSDLQAGIEQSRDAGQTAHASVLHQGMHNDEVKRAQDELHDLGYLQADPNGRFGPQTKAAAEDFQRTQGLQVDGKIGPTTQQHLDSAVRDKQIEGMTTSVAQLRDFSDPSHPQNALYNTLKEGFPPGVSPQVLSECTAACYMAGIKQPSDLGSVIGMNGSIIFESNSLFGNNARIDLSQPTPSVQQTMQNVQQFDQQQAINSAQFQAQQAQINAQAPNGPKQWEPGF